MFVNVKEMTFLSWLTTLPPWLWCPNVATMINEIVHDEDFPDTSSYADAYRHLYFDNHVPEDGIECFDALWSAYVSQTRGERWIKPNEDDECYLPF